MAQVRTNLVGHRSLDEGTGNMALNFSGNNLALTIQGVGFENSRLAP